MPHIIPIRDLKDTNRISELCHSANAPIFVTKNGYDDMVIMSSAVFDALISNYSIAAEVTKGLREIDSGLGIDGQTVKKKLGEKF